MKAVSWFTDHSPLTTHQISSEDIRRLESIAGSADAQIEKHGSHADLIAVFQFPFSTDRRRFHMRTFTLGALADQFPIHKRSIQAAEISDPDMRRLDFQHAVMA